MALNYELSIREKMLSSIPETLINKLIAHGFTPEHVVDYDIERRLKLSFGYESSIVKNDPLFTFIVNDKGELIDIEIKSPDTD